MKSKHLLFCLFFCLIPPLLFSQYLEKNENLISRFKPGLAWFYSGTTPNEAEKLRKYDRLMIDLTYDDWQGDRELFTSPWNSIGFSVSFMKNSVLTKANTISLGYGLAFSRYNNKTNTPLYIDEISESTSFAESYEDSNNEQWSFHANYLEIPIELRFRTKGYKHFKFIFGGKIGYQLNAYRKLKFKSSGNKYTNKLYNFPDRNMLRYGVTARVGIRNWSLFAAYYFSPLFTQATSVDLTPLSLGISISLF